MDVRYFLLFLVFLASVGGYVVFLNQEAPSTIDECEALEGRTTRRFYTWDPYYYKNKCYRDYAIATRKPTLCLNINHEESKLRCLALITGDQTVCTQLPTTESQQRCMAEATLLSRNQAGCANIPHGQTRDNCYWDNAKLSRDPSLCVKIVDQNVREWCFMSTGRRT